MALRLQIRVAKCVVGIADSLVTNLYSQAGKCRVPSIVYPCDTAPEIKTTAPGGKKVMVYPRKIDLEGTSKLSTFEYTTVVQSVDELIVTVKNGWLCFQALRSRH